MWSLSEGMALGWIIRQNNMSFQWIPNTQPDKIAIERLKTAFSKPSQPPPVAWFMSGEVDYYNNITAIKPGEIPLNELEWYFSDTCSGLRNFPDVEFAIKSWKDTYNYLLPRLIERCHEGTMLSDLIGYFFQVYPETIPDIYPEFRSDILHILGQAIMQSIFWGKDDLSGLMIQSEWHIYLLYGSNSYIHSLSPAIYFCLKYLTPSEIELWADSLLRISGRYWHFNLMSWMFAEAFQLLIYFDRSNTPSSLSVKPKINFGDNANIQYFELPTANVQAFISKLKVNRLFMNL